MIKTKENILFHLSGLQFFSLVLLDSAHCGSHACITLCEGSEIKLIPVAFQSLHHPRPPYPSPTPAITCVTEHGS